jgi:CDP-glucose 4,6-dehydratase
MEPGDRWKHQPVLVTGAQGFIGSWLAERLLDEGARVVATRRDVDPRSRFRREGIEERCDVVEVDVLDGKELASILREHQVRVVFHLAAQPIVPIANRSPLSTYESNVRGAYTVLESCRVAREAGMPIERIVVASTDHAYGAHDALPYREDFALRAVYPYDVSKACTDMIARCYAATYELPVAVTRLANTYGGGDRNWSRIVPDTARAIIRGERPVIRSDGSPERDFLYVKDAVEVYLAVASSLHRRELWGRAWNAGLGEPVSVLELVNRLIAVSGSRVEPEIQGRGTPRGEIDRQYLDSTAIRSELGWSPGWTLDEGLHETFVWYAHELSSGAPHYEQRVA